LLLHFGHFHVDLLDMVRDGSTIFVNCR
jgi:hypothetical protein